MVQESESEEIFDEFDQGEPITTTVQVHRRRESEEIHWSKAQSEQDYEHGGDDEQQEVSYVMQEEDPLV